MAEERARHPGTPVEVWAVDEHRTGLKPVLRRAWAKRGRRPVAVAEPRYEWLYVYGFVRPTTGTLVWFLCNTVNTALFAAVLACFAAEIGAGPAPTAAAKRANTAANSAVLTVLHRNQTSAPVVGRTKP